MTARAPETIETARLVLHRPLEADVEEIFARYASDVNVTRLLGWTRHESLADARAFLAYSDVEWSRWPAGPYLVRSRTDGALLGSTGLAFETAYRAQTGYVFARDAWGMGYATESLQAMIELSRSLGVRRLYAVCHTGHSASRHVLEKCGFLQEGVLHRHTEFPNLAPGDPCDVFCYALLV